MECEYALSDIITVRSHNTVVGLSSRTNSDFIMGITQILFESSGMEYYVFYFMQFNAVTLQLLFFNLIFRLLRLSGWLDGSVETPIMLKSKL